MISPRLASLVMLLVASAVAWAQPQGPVGRRMIQKEMRIRESMPDKLHLTDAQEAQMKKLRLELQKKQTAVGSKIRIARLDLQEQFLAGAPDKGLAEKRVKEITGLQEQMKLNMLDHWFAVNSILTPEQQKIWKGHFGRMGNQGRGRMLHRGCPCCLGEVLEGETDDRD